MKAIFATAAGAKLCNTEMPTPGPDEILVKVRAAALNRADLASLAAKDGKVLGMEWAGEIVNVGHAVTEWKPGDRVMCTGSAAYAEYAVTDRGRAMRIPDDMPLEEAATLMLACQTMHNAIATASRMQRGETLMIHGASSGVGLIGMQIGKLLGARVVIGTSTNSMRCARLGEFGADYAINASSSGWVESILRATGGKGVDVIVDQVSGRELNKTMKACAMLGRIVNVGRLGGNEGVVDLNWHALRRISYHGVTFRTRSVQEIRDLTAFLVRDLGGAIANRKLRLPIERVFPLEQAAAALDHMKSNTHFGKIVLSI
ncbi:zinc-binding dehydrogenase [Paraburkholderia sp. MM5384-R2]|uniref:zinc-binding dehydrogenase n=1 Tax=Paraburkholderia sp. MM5384-R2 TaxID=2723097 RepID=UPI0016211D92|nr:zinc-binding dehydrogenase [Paraburkholderia sp. MM5384-R2]MBB5498837.1 NADPH2:quinone reductase [Paraburkholderia sp. MM5384-R2]